MQLAGWALNSPNAEVDCPSKLRGICMNLFVQCEVWVGVACKTCMCDVYLSELCAKKRRGDISGV